MEEGVRFARYTHPPRHPYQPGFPFPERPHLSWPRTLALTSVNPAPSSKPPPTPFPSDPTASQHRPLQRSPLWGRTRSPQAPLCLAQPVPLLCRDPQCGLCWGLRSQRIIGQSGQHHGGFAGESWRHLQGSSPGPLGAWPCIPAFVGTQEAPRSPVLMATSRRRSTKRGWKRF